MTDREQLIDIILHGTQDDLERLKDALFEVLEQRTNSSTIKKI